MAANEILAVLFTDQVNSTEESSRITPEAAEELRRQHFSILRRALSDCDGREIKNTGDGLMIVFGAASSALSCAVAMQQMVDVTNRAHGLALGLRVGISGGEVTPAEGDYWGHPVVEAARLVALAKGGQILTADIVRTMAGRNNSHRLTPLGPIELKGLPEPVTTFVVEWEPTSEPLRQRSHIPLPSRLEAHPVTGVIGRDMEVEELLQVYSRVLESGRQEAAFVSGEAGMGKTTLAAEFAKRAADAGACVLFGRCEEDFGVPHKVFADAMNHFVAYVPDEVLESHVESFGGEIIRMLPELKHRIRTLPPPQSNDPDTERYLLFRSVGGLLAYASENSPVVLVLDDLQWADTPSLQLLRYLMRSYEPLRLMIVGTYRDTELFEHQPLTDTFVALGREGPIARVSLGGLSESGVVSLLEAAAGHSLDNAGLGLANAVFQETDGNPFFVGEILRNLAETQVIFRGDNGRWQLSAELAELTLPDSVRDVIGSRVARLGNVARSVLLLASVIGRNFDVLLLARVSQHTEDEIIDILERAAAVAIVSEIDEKRYTFSHALVQHTLYQGLGAHRKLRAHRRVAQALEDLYGDEPGDRAGELAHHWSCGEMSDDLSKAIYYERQAADAAFAALAPEDAGNHFSRALQLLERLGEPDQSLKVQLLLGLGNAQKQAGDPNFRETLLDAARRARLLGDTEALVDAALLNNRGFFSALGVIDAERVAVLESAIEDSPAQSTAERAMLLATLCNELSHGPFERRGRLAREAKGIARELRDPATIIRVTDLVHTALEFPSWHEERMKDSAEAFALAAELGDPFLLYWAANLCHTNAVQAGKFGLADRCLSTMRTESDRLRQPILMWSTAYHQAGHALMKGDHRECEEFANRALQIGTNSGQPDALAFYGTQLMAIRLQQGRLNELLEMVYQAVDENPGVPSYRSALAQSLLDAGKPAEAAEIVRLAGSDGFISHPKDIAWLDGMVNFSEVAIELEMKESAEDLANLLAPFYGQIPFEGLIVNKPVAAYLGGLHTVLGNYEEAERYFIEANRLNDLGEMKFAKAWTALARAKLFLAWARSGDRDLALSLLNEAATIAKDNGYVSIAKCADSLITHL
jgi:class 3 adenylate cyclase/tetratricopeptide (TPR) repeat protein